MSSLLAEKHIETVLRKRFARIQIIESQSRNNEERLLLRRRNLVETLNFLRTDPDTLLDTLVDISAIHHLNMQSCVYSREFSSPFYEVFYLLRSTRLKYRLRISVYVSEHLASVPTIGPIFRNSDWLEREMHDLFGIFVEGHPDLRRLILYPSFEGHPLNKRYSLHLEQPLVLLKPL